MSYKSPIDLIMGQIEFEKENEIVRAVQQVGINIDKEELIRALAYDRNQYAKGYHDRDSEIVRCKDCKHRDPEDGRCDSGHDIRWNLPRQDDWFCKDGERR